MAKQSENVILISRRRRRGVALKVAPTNKIFSPSLDELDFHRQVIEEFEAAEKDGRGVLTVNGKMIENLHVDEARRALAMAEAIAAL